MKTEDTVKIKLILNHTMFILIEIERDRETERQSERGGEAMRRRQKGRKRE
jgi:hypothetical protein